MIRLGARQTAMTVPRRPRVLVGELGVVRADGPKSVPSCLDNTHYTYLRQPPPTMDNSRLEEGMRNSGVSTLQMNWSE